jgi:hypothetical protein
MIYLQFIYLTELRGTNFFGYVRIPLSKVTGSNMNIPEFIATLQKLNDLGLLETITGRQPHDLTESYIRDNMDVVNLYRVYYVKE